MNRPRFRLSGDRALLVEYGDTIDPAVNEKVRAMTTLLKTNLPEGVEAVVPAYRSLSMIYDPLVTSPEKLLALLLKLEADSTRPRFRCRIVPIPVCMAASSVPTSTWWQSTPA